MDLSLLWIPATLAGAAGQIARNAAQRRLTEIIGTIGATQVRFLYGFPFALIFLGLILALGGEPLAGSGRGFRGLPPARRRVPDSGHRPDARRHARALL